MAKPYEIQQQFTALVPDVELLARLYKRHQQEYLRTRLKAIRMLWEGMSRQEVIAQLSIDRKSLLTWVKTLVTHGVQAGLRLLATAKRIKKSGKLTAEQEQRLTEMVEQESPKTYGYSHNIFTGQIFVELVDRLWNISVSDQTIYNSLDRQGFSYQRGHRDYENADPAQQRAYAERLKAQLDQQSAHEKHLFFDEFSLSNRPTTFYGWARKNTRFKVPSNESQKRERVNGFLAVDANSGKEYLVFSDSAKTEALVDYFYDLALTVKREGFSWMRITLDNNSTHKDKMRYQLWLKMRTNSELQDFRVLFNNTPAYSPDFNLAEYIIHQIRLQLVHHIPANTALEDIMRNILTYLKRHQLHTKEQIKKTINRILRLGGVTCGI
jgi:transposase